MKNLYNYRCIKEIILFINSYKSTKKLHVDERELVLQL